MKWAALIAWVATAGGGFVLFSIWLLRGGLRQRERGRIRPPLIVSHFLLAATGLVLWIVYLVNDSRTLSWVAFAILALVALLGFTMLAIWIPQYQQRQRHGQPIAAGGAGDEPVVPAEQHFPVPIVVLHGLLAATTLVLVLLTALEVGTS
jgi:hypothetical protein